VASMHSCAEILARFIVGWCGLASRGVHGAVRARPDGVPGPMDAAKRPL
jgi:hypothetical protein